MSVFGKYAKYYDLLYQDKNYSKEADYIDRLIKTYHPESKTILDLGCGTGRHDILLAEKGFFLTGVDSSKEMLSAAINEKEDQHVVKVIKEQACHLQKTGSL